MGCKSESHHTVMMDYLSALGCDWKVSLVSEGRTVGRCLLPNGAKDWNGNVILLHGFTWEGLICEQKALVVVEPSYSFNCQ